MIKFFSKPFKLIFSDGYKITSKLVYAKDTSDAMDQGSKSLRSAEELSEKHKKSRVGLVITLDPKTNQEIK